MTRSRMRPADVVRAGASGLRFRRTRTLLSALGIAIGIAALVAVLGITKSSQSALVAEIDQLGTSLLTVTNGSTLSGGEAELPKYAIAMMTWVAGVEQVAPTAIITSAQVYRTDMVPGADTGGLAVRAAGPSLVTTLGGSIRQGAFLNAATSKFPATVLGYQAAQTLGIDSLAGSPRVRIGARWFAVQGILNPFPLAPEIDRSALIGFPEAASALGYDGHPSRIYVRTDPVSTAQVQQLLGQQADPEAPNEVAVSQPSDVLTARLAVVSSGTQLFLGLGAVVLLVGGIGIANVMIVAVLERRSEIGLRRSLGATRPHIAEQFLAESATLAALGGIGAIAGLYPAIRAARLSPAEALRTT